VKRLSTAGDWARSPADYFLRRHLLPRDSSNRQGIYLAAVFVWLTTALGTHAGSSFGSEHYEVEIRHGVPVKMRDGVILRADIYQPKAGGVFPVLLQRTPYNKDTGAEVGLRAAARGYVVIIQDCRGRFSSEGEWYPFKYESHDGYDTVEWAASLPKTNGKVGMFGASYNGATQMLAAIAHPPHLAGVFSYITPSNYHEGWAYVGGAFQLWVAQSWTSVVAVDTLSRLVDHANGKQWTSRLPLGNSISTYPLFSYPVFGLGGAGPETVAPYFFDWLAHPSYDDYWKQWSIEEQYANVRVPVYNVGAWYDVFLHGTLQNYGGIKANGGTPAAREGQRLLMIVGGHAGAGRKIGAVDFGVQADIDVDEVMLHWYDYVLKGARNGEESEKPVKLFVMGKNTWRSEDEWPLARARNTPFYLHSGGAASGLRGDGTLSNQPPQVEPPDSFVYDPANPVPTLGGACCAAGLPIGPMDQRPNEERKDVLVYSTSAFKEDFEVTGPISVELYESSSAVDTDFTAKLVDVWPNGFAQNLTDSVLRARYRNSREKPELMHPGETYKLTLDLMGTSIVFAPGHKLRLEISSSNFPRFDRNLNTGDDFGQATRSEKAKNILYHDRAHPSAIILPIVPR
jgi:putative CocE/NonD family hydrolase